MLRNSLYSAALRTPQVQQNRIRYARLVAYKKQHYGCDHFPHNYGWNITPKMFVFSLFNFYRATMTIKGSLLVSVHIVKRFSAEIFLSPTKIGPKMAVFREIEI